MPPSFSKATPHLPLLHPGQQQRTNSDMNSVCESTPSLTRGRTDPKQGINLVDEDYTGGEPSSNGEHDSHQFRSFAYALDEIKHVRLVVAGQDK